MTGLVRFEQDLVKILARLSASLFLLALPRSIEKHSWLAMIEHDHAMHAKIFLISWQDLAIAAMIRFTGLSVFCFNRGSPVFR